MGGTLIWGLERPVDLQYCRLRCGTVQRGKQAPDTLLGPEGSGNRPSGQDRKIPAGPLGHRTGRVCDEAMITRDARPNFENYTVDASIFSICGKLLRAHGGCLGIRSRRRT